MHIDATPCRNERQVAVRVLAAYTGSDGSGIPATTVLAFISRRLAWAQDRHVTVTGLKPGIVPSALTDAVKAGGGDITLRYRPGTDRSSAATRAIKADVLRLIGQEPRTFGSILAALSVGRRVTPSRLRRLTARMAQEGTLIRNVTIGGDGGTRSTLTRYESHPT